MSLPRNLYVVLVLLALVTEAARFSGGCGGGWNVQAEPLDMSGRAAPKREAPLADSDSGVEAEPNSEPERKIQLLRLHQDAQCLGTACEHMTWCYEGPRVLDPARVFLETVAEVKSRDQAASGHASSAPPCMRAVNLDSKIRHWVESAYPLPVGPVGGSPPFKACARAEPSAGAP